MKKVSVILMMMLVMVLSGCTNEIPEGHDNIVLPDLSGKNETEIRDTFDNLGHIVTFEYFDEEDEFLSNIFIEYKDYNHGDIVNETNDIVIIVLN